MKLVLFFLIILTTNSFIYASKNDASSSTEQNFCVSEVPHSDYDAASLLSLRETAIGGVLKDPPLELEFPFLEEKKYFVAEFLAEFGDLETGDFDGDAGRELLEETFGFHPLKSMIFIDQVMGAGVNEETGSWASLNFNTNPELTDIEFLKQYQAYALVELVGALPHVLAYMLDASSGNEKLSPIILDIKPNTDDGEYLFSQINYYDVEDLARTARSMARIVTSLHGDQRMGSQVAELLLRIAEVAEASDQEIKLLDQQGFRSLIVAQKAKVVEVNLINPLFDELENIMMENYEDFVPNINPAQQREAIVSLFAMTSELTYGSGRNDSDRVVNMNVLSNIWRDVLFEAMLAWRYGSPENYISLLRHIDHLNLEEIPGQADCCWTGYDDTSFFRSAAVISRHFELLSDYLDQSSVAINISADQDAQYDQLQIPNMTVELNFDGQSLTPFVQFGDLLGQGQILLVERHTHLSLERASALSDKLDEIKSLATDLSSSDVSNESDFKNKKDQMLQLAQSLQADGGDINRFLGDLEELLRDINEYKIKVEEHKNYLDANFDLESVDPIFVRAIEDLRFDLVRLMTTAELMRGTLALSLNEAKAMNLNVTQVITGVSAMTYVEKSNGGLLDKLNAVIDGIKSYVEPR